MQSYCCLFSKGLCANDRWFLQVRRTLQADASTTCAYSTMLRTAGDLRTALGEDPITRLLAKNKEEAALFAQNLHTAAQPFVLNPTAFVVDPAKTGRKWTHSEYREFWNLVIAKKCRTLYFNEGWHFSNSCTSAYLSGLKVGARLFDHAKNTLGLDTAKKLIRGAIVRLEDYGFDVANLQGVFEEIRSFAGLG